MADEETTATTYHFRSLAEILQIPAPDDLITGVFKADTIVLATAGEYKRGMLLMSSGSGFVKATASGLASANEICILSDNAEIPDGEAAPVSAYFSGTFNGERVILPWEQEGDTHAELLESIRPVLRRQNIFIA